MSITSTRDYGPLARIQDGQLHWMALNTQPVRRASSPEPDRWPTVEARALALQTRPTANAIGHTLRRAA